MTNRCHRCGGHATAGANPLFPERSRCVLCAAAARVSIPINPERLDNAPAAIAGGPAWPIAGSAARGQALWLHQANALHELERGRNIAIATSTASGKTLVFQLWTLHQMAQDPEATALVFYPTKALANDQARRWRECCRTLGLDGNAVGQIDGDVSVSKRDGIMNESRIILATPDVCHAWLLRHCNEPAVGERLRHLKVVVIDEAHTYESVFGSNSAYLFRRLTAAALNAGAAEPPRFIAATATIQTPEEHLERLTGLEFTVIEETENGSPRHSRELCHLHLNPRGGTGEEQMARLVINIIDNDPNAQVIAFHDSRQGIERVVQRINRPGEVLPYRSGYLAQDRRDIETKLRDNTIRGVIATSALELGIDMPDLNYGINLDLPPSRKQFHQRLGRVGRTQPGTFIILAPASRFSAYGETLRDYYDNSVEPSHLYLDNEYVNYQQAVCLKDELERSGRDARIPPEGTSWPQGFEDALRNAHGRPPAHLRALQEQRSETAPQLAHSLRNSGDETLQILAGNENGGESNIGYINLPSAMGEAYPGAVYHHRGASYRIEGWARNRKNRQPFIRAARMADSGRRTRPILRRTATLPQDPGCVINRRDLPGGHAAEMKILVTESVEGYEDPNEGVVLYQRQMLRDPRLSRKQREMPTTAVHLRISEPWFSGDSGEPWQARRQIAQALRLHLAYHQSIALPDLGFQAENVIMETPMGYVELNDSIVIHDNIHGGMGLVGSLYRNIGRYAKNLNVSTEDEPGAVYPQYASELVRWLDQAEEAGMPEQKEPGQNDWWRVVRAGSRVKVFSEARNELVDGAVEKCEWRNGVLYLVKAGDEAMRMRDEQLTPAESAFDWELWQPSTGRRQELQFSR